MNIESHIHISQPRKNAATLIMQSGHVFWSGSNPIGGSQYTLDVTRAFANALLAACDEMEQLNKEAGVTK